MTDDPPPDGQERRRIPRLENGDSPMLHWLVQHVGGERVVRASNTAEAAVVSRYVLPGLVSVLTVVIIVCGALIAVLWNNLAGSVTTLEEKTAKALAVLLAKDAEIEARLAGLTATVFAKDGEHDSRIVRIEDRLNRNDDRGRERR